MDAPIFFSLISFRKMTNNYEEVSKGKLGVELVEPHIDNNTLTLGQAQCQDF